ncbi:response regulator transcription factor [Flavimarina sp. Hel_I_48]|nr:response regulator transcription factor [Flavimarina sp. Hel_I_48]
MKFLIAEDEKELQKAIARYLRRDSHVCEVTADYWSALEKLELFD